MKRALLGLIGFGLAGLLLAIYFRIVYPALLPWLPTGISAEFFLPLVFTGALAGAVLGQRMEAALGFALGCPFLSIAFIRSVASPPSGLPDLNEIVRFTLPWLACAAVAGGLGSYLTATGRRRHSSQSPAVMALQGSTIFASAALFCSLLMVLSVWGIIEALFALHAISGPIIGVALHHWERTQ